MPFICHATGVRTCDLLQVKPFLGPHSRLLSTDHLFNNNTLNKSTHRIHQTTMDDGTFSAATTTTPSSSYLDIISLFRRHHDQCSQYNM